MITVYRHDPDTARLVDKFVRLPAVETWVQYWTKDSEEYAVTIVEEHFTRADIARALIGVKAP